MTDDASPGDTNDQRSEADDDAAAITHRRRLLGRAVNATSTTSASYLEEVPAGPLHESYARLKR